MNKIIRKCVFCGEEKAMLVRSRIAPMHFIECENCGAVISFRANEEAKRTLQMYDGMMEEGIERWQNLPAYMK